MPSSRHQQPLSGFTLLELLVAIAILAIIGIGSYRLLASTISTRDRAAAHDQQLIQLEKAMAAMQRDIEQATQRPIRDELGDTQPALYFPAPNTIDLTRAGWRNPMQEPRSEMVRVRYVVEDGELHRYYWDALDRMPGMQPHVSVLLQKVEDFHLRALDPGSGQWADSWPLATVTQKAADQTPLPAAIEVTFSVAPYGNLRRVFLVAGGFNGSGS